MLYGRGIRDRVEASELGFGRLQRVVVPQDLLLEPAQLGARFEPELVAQRSPRIDVRLERVGLSPRAIEGQHQWAAQRLSQRMFGDERLELADQLAVATQPQVAVDPLRQRLEALLVQPLRLVRREGLERQVAKRPSAPEREPFPISRRRSVEIATLALSPRLRHERLESVGVDGALLRVEDIPRRLGAHECRGSVTERFAQARDIDLNGFRGSRGRRLAPELVDQSLRRHNLTAVEEQDTENGALLGVTELDNLALAEHLERAQDVELHPPVLPLSKPVS